MSPTALGALTFGRFNGGDVVVLVNGGGGGVALVVGMVEIVRREEREDGKVRRRGIPRRESILGSEAGARVEFAEMK